MSLTAYLILGGLFTGTVLLAIYIAYRWGKDSGQSEVRLDNAEKNAERAQKYAENNANERGHAVTVDRLQDGKF